MTEETIIPGYSAFSFGSSFHNGAGVQERVIAGVEIWNFSATNIQTDPDIDTEGKFTWWDGNGFWWKFMPPIIVGFHGNLEFDATQMKRVESIGNLVEPYSLYEAQLRKRLGYVPSWLSSLK